MNESLFKSMLLGVAVGDALGVPYEFKSRELLDRYPAKEMTGYGSHHVPAGTWSDDSSLTFCLAEMLANKFDLKALAGYFINWLEHGYWTATGHVFDVGITTRYAIHRLEEGVDYEMAGGTHENENGNGSLMRILPLLAYIYDKPVEERYQLTKSVSSLTHAHARSVLACFYYLEYARLLLDSKDKFEAYEKLRAAVYETTTESSHFDRLLKNDISQLRRDQIKSSGYVIHTLEASLWCLLTTNNYKDAVLTAVNLGEDTDTTAAVTGGLAGILYGFENIPKEWLSRLARKKDIEDLAERLHLKYRI